MHSLLINVPLWNTPREISEKKKERERKKEKKKKKKERQKRKKINNTSFYLKSFNINP